MRSKRKGLLILISVISILSLVGSITSIASAQLRAITVPWYPGKPSVPHNAYNGHPTTFKAIARGGTGSYTYEWDFNGDGTYDSSNTTTNRYNLSVRYTYPNQSSDKTFIARIRVTSGTETDTAEYPVTIYADASLGVRVNVAIDDGLWYLHTSQARSTSGDIDYGYWYYSGYYASPTASAVQAFEVHGHLETGDYDTNPYVETVSRGLKYMFTRLSSQGISNQTYGNPDTNGNGIGISGTGNRQIYELGQIMDAIVATGTPDAVTTTGGTNIIGRTYKDILQDMVDMYAWGQYDSASVGGGWRYSWNTHPDNSAAQWGAIGMLAAEEIFGLSIPQWVKDRNNVWLNYSYDGTGFGYTSRGCGVALTPGGMVQLAFCDKTTADSRWRTAENWIANNWDWWIGRNNFYAYYAFTKAMREAQQDADLEPEPVIDLTATGLDWYGDETRGLAQKLVSLQSSSGYWNYYGTALGTGWTLIILNPTLFERVPIAIAKAHPVSVPCGGGPGSTVNFDHSDSKHMDSPTHEIVLIKWDFDASDGIDWDSPDYSTDDLYASPTHVYVRHGQYIATLQVVDDNDPPKTAEASIVINVTIENHKPVADPGGPYEILAHMGVTLDASGSFDPDESCGDEVVEYWWDLDNDGINDDANDGIVTLTWAELNSFGITGPDEYVIRLMVVDSFGEEDIEITTLSVYSNEPIAVANAEPLEAPPTYSIRFDGSASYHTNPGKEIVRYEWDFESDGIYDAEGIMVTHSYDAVDTYTATLRVTDNNDPPLTDTDPIDITIKPPPNPPVADADPDEPDDGYITEIGVGITLDGSHSFDPDEEIWEDYVSSYEWDLDNDGSFDDASTAIVNLSWEDLVNLGIFAVGSHIITLRVTDAGLYGAPPLSDTETTVLDIYINEPVAVAVAIPDEVGCNQEVTFDGSNSYHQYPLRDIVGYEWDFEGDGIYDAEGIMVTHTYNRFGTYQATLRVTDNNVPPKTDTAQVEVRVTIGNNPPVADGNPLNTDPAYETSLGIPVLLDASQSYDPDASCGDEIVKYEWDTDNDDLYGTDDDPDDLVGVMVSYVNPGWEVENTYAVHLRVTDTFGATDVHSPITIYIVPNMPPVASCMNVTVDADESCQANASIDNGSSDPDPGDTIILSQDPPGPYGLGDTIVTLTATDSYGATDTCEATVTVQDTTPPVLENCPGDITTDNDPGQCGAAVTWTPPTATDNCPDVSLSSNHTPGGFFFSECADTATGTQVTYTATDDSGNTASCSFKVTVVDRDPPVLGEIVTTLDPVQLNTPVETNAGFTDSCPFDTHTALWDWGDGITSSGDVTESGGSGSVAGNHAYTIPGVYTVQLTVTDDCGNSSDISIFQYIVVYDPDDGFVTGGGWIDSPEGAYNPDPDLTGKANFGFVSKYKRGAMAPIGQTEFQFKVADFNFHSDSYEWLVVAGPRAQFKGTGTINGEGNYEFILTAIDGQISGGGGADKFRIMIWSGDGMVYDNQPGAPIDGEPATVIDGGSIVIHSR